MLSSPKVLLDPKLATALPYNVNLKTPTPSPFCLLSVCGSDSYDCIAHHLFELSSLVCHLFELSSLSISFLHMTPKLSSLVCLLFTCGLGTSQLNSCYPFHLLSVHRSSSPWPNFQSPFCLLSMHELSSSQLNSRSPLCATSPWFPMWSFNTCMNVQQVWQGLISKMERSSNLHGSNFLFKVFCKQHEIVF